MQSDEIIVLINNIYLLMCLCICIIFFISIFTTYFVMYDHKLFSTILLLL